MCIGQQVHCSTKIFKCCLQDLKSFNFKYPNLTILLYFIRFWHCYIKLGGFQVRKPKSCNFFFQEFSRFNTEEGQCKYLHKYKSRNNSILITCTLVCDQAMCVLPETIFYFGLCHYVLKSWQFYTLSFHQALSMVKFLVCNQAQTW